jgi:bifunctional oligoribonuclease and PAP phosphatase NrnA
LTRGISDSAVPSHHERLEHIPLRAAEIRDMILRHERIAILTHSNPDADAVASALAMRIICVHLGRSPILVVAGDGNIPDNLMFLNSVLTLTERVDDTLTSADLVIYVDCAEASRIGSVFKEYEEFLSEHPQTINIDHHVTNNRFGTINCIVPEAAASAEIIEIIRETLEVPLSAELATAMLAGIYGDTLGLRTPSTTPSTMRVAAELVEAGAEIDVVVDWLFRVKPYSAVKLWAEALGRADWVGPVIWTAVELDMLERTQSSAAEAEGLINFLAGTIGARASVLAYEEPNGWRVSLRSVHDSVDVSEIAKAFGGGGHPRASGLRLSEGRETLTEFLNTMSDMVSAMSSDEHPGAGDDDKA